MLVISRDGPLPLDRLELEVESRGQVLRKVSYRVPKEAELPTSIAIASNGDPRASVTIGVTGWQGELPLDRRDTIVTQIPTDRVAVLKVVLSARCSGAVTVSDGEARTTCGEGKTCDAQTGQCVSSSIDASSLPTFQVDEPLSNEGGASGAPDSTGGSGTIGNGGMAGEARPDGGEGPLPSGGSGGSGVGGAPSGGSSGSGNGGTVAGPGGAPGSDGGAAGNDSGAAGNDGAAGEGGAGPVIDECAKIPVLSPIVGWATQAPGTTTGGGQLTPIVVTNAADLNTNLAGTTPRVIRVSGTIAGTFAVGSNKTIFGTCGAQLRGHVGISGSTNVIMSNLKVVGNNCQDSPQDCSGGTDAISIQSNSNHIYLDHLDVSDGSDDNLDIVTGSDFVTVAWTKFSFSSLRSDPEAGTSGHRYSNLIGASDNAPTDPGRLNTTFHHCWWAANIDQRMPRARYGKVHLYNNLFSSAGNASCSVAGFDAKLLIENNVYTGVANPIQVLTDGAVQEANNVFMNTTGSKTGAGTAFTPPYAYSLDATTNLAAAIMAGVGPR